jgi:DNA replication licensing factor MCM4
VVEEIVVNEENDHSLLFPPSPFPFSSPLPLHQEVIPIMDSIASEIYSTFFNDNQSESQTELRMIQVRTSNLHRIGVMRDLSPSDIDKLVCIRGMVIRTSPIIPDLKQAFFECQLCNSSVTVAIDRGRIEEPTKYISSHFLLFFYFLFFFFFLNSFLLFKFLISF